MVEGTDPLDAVIAGVNLVEDDPDDFTVGLGGLPNEQGIVELDAAVMHGPTHRAGAVAALRNIKNPSKVAQRVMEQTDHVLLVGEGGTRQQFLDLGIGLTLGRRDHVSLLNNDHDVSCQIESRTL